MNCVYCNKPIMTDEEMQKCNELEHADTKFDGGEHSERDRPSYCICCDHVRSGTKEEYEGMCRACATDYFTPEMW